MTTKPLLLVLLLAGTLLAGCSQPSLPELSQWSLDVVRMDSETGCAGYVCQADPDGEHAMEIRDEFGLELLTDDDHVPVQQTLHMEGEWVVWTGYDPKPGPRGDIMAMHLPTREVYGVAMGPGHSIRPFLDEGRVVFQYASENYTGLATWDVGADTVKPLLIEPKGNYRISDFQGDWIAVSIGGSQNESHAGEWVWNIQSNTGHRIYVPPPNPERGPPEEWVAGQGVDLNEEYAYFIVSWRNEAGETPTVLYDVHEINLSTGENRVLPHDIGRPAAIEAATKNVVLHTAEHGIYLYSRDNNTYWRTDIEEGRDCTNLFGKREWVWVDCDNPRSSDFVFYNTVESPPLHAYDVSNEFQYLSTATDGRSIVFIGARPTDDYLNLYLETDFLPMESKEPQESP